MIRSKQEKLSFHASSFLAVEERSWKEKTKMNRGTEAVLLLLQKLEEGSSAEQTAPAPPSSCNTD